MAATHKKLIFGGAQTAGQAVVYLADPQAAGDYYSESEHAFMRWVASPRAREVLGLNPQVELWKLERLLNGQHPITGKSIRRWGSRKVKDPQTGEVVTRESVIAGGHDVTISPAPKSVSIVWALADDQLRREIEVMVGQAADEAFQTMLRRVPLVKERYGPGPNDLRLVKADDYVAVEALHSTARLTEAKPNVPDPDLHLHSVLIGAVDQKGQLRAIESLSIRRFRTELGAIASSALAEMFRERGWEVERTLVKDRHGRADRAHWELAGVPQSLIKAMSTRSQEIEDLKRRYRELYGLEPDGPGFERFLLTHRGPKSRRSSEELRAEWAAEGREHGYGPEQVAQAHAEALARQQAGIEIRGEQSPQAQQLREEILANLTRDHALVPKRQLDALLMQRSEGLVDPLVALGVLARMYGDADVLVSADGQKVTTLETLALEQRAVRATDQLLEAPHERKALQEQLEREYREAEEQGHPFDQAQRQAIALATSGARFVSITGPAGTGKGLAMHSAVNIWHHQGRRVLALALAGRTAQQAQADSAADLGFTLDGLQARTEHSVLELHASDVLLVDEAAMVDHHRYADFLELAAQASVTVVQVGDDAQLSPVEAGGLWTVTHGMAEDAQLAVELETIRRARNPAEGQAWTDLREGRIEQGLSWYAQQERLHLYETRAELLHGIVAEWRTRDPEGVMVVDTTNEERDSINRIAQAKRLEAGEISHEALALANGRQIHAGDRVIFQEIHHFPDLPDAPLTRRVENGTVATVLSLDREAGGPRHLNDAERASMARASQLGEAQLLLHEPAGDRRVTVEASAPLELAYARHVYKAQGMTVEVGQIATGPSTTQERLYVMTSRAREGTHIHAVQSELEDLGAQPAHIELEKLSSRELGPVGLEAEVQPQAEAVSGRELLDAIDAAITERQTEAEYATIRRIEQRAVSERKKAVTTREPREWSQPVEFRATQEQRQAGDRQGRESARPQFDSDYEHNPRHQAGRVPEPEDISAIARPARSDQLRPPSIGELAQREQRIAREAQFTREQREGPIPESMPARTAAESVGRIYAERGQPLQVLGFYRYLGQLEHSSEPEVAAVEHALSHPEQGGLIIAQDQGQRERLQGLLSERQSLQEPPQADAQPASRQEAPQPPQPVTVITAHDAYLQRAEARQQWVQRTLEARQGQQDRGGPFMHHVEPGGLNATVVVSDPRNAAAISRGTSATAQAHLVTGEPTVLDGHLIEFGAQEVQATQEARAQQRTESQAQQTQQAQREQATQRTAEAAPEAQPQVQIEAGR
jgi:conjugative relaxase-like TrwC/TraI family protein